MNTEKEILLNKEEIKALENKIKIDEEFISKELIDSYWLFPLSIPIS